MNNSGIFYPVSLPLLSTAECADLKKIACLVSKLNILKREFVQ